MASFAELPKLNCFKCRENNFKKTLTLNLGDFPSLVDFSCEYQSFSFTELQPIRAMKKLETIRFGDTTFLRTPMLFLFDMPQLKTVVLGPRCFLHTLTMHFASRNGECHQGRTAAAPDDHDADE